MGNPTYSIESSRVKELFLSLMEKAVYRHNTVKGRYMVAVLRETRTIFIYDFSRAVRPLFRIVEGGNKTLIRDFYSEEEGIVLLEALEKSLLQKKDVGDKEMVDLPVIGTRDPVVGLNSEGKVALVSSR